MIAVYLFGSLVCLLLFLSLASYLYERMLEYRDADEAVQLHREYQVFYIEMDWHLPVYGLRRSKLEERSGQYY
jgi:hypothetical protein